MEKEVLVRVSKSKPNSFCSKYDWDPLIQKAIATGAYRNRSHFVELALKREIEHTLQMELVEQ